MDFGINFKMDSIQIINEELLASELKGGYIVQNDVVFTPQAGLQLEMQRYLCISNHINQYFDV